MRMFPEVVVDGFSSESALVTSGVTQGTLLFLIYIDTIHVAESITSSIRLFADYCLLYMEIATRKDATALQRDYMSEANTGRWPSISKSAIP